LAQWLTRDKTIKQMKSTDVNLDKAMGRLAGGLYIITAHKGDLQSAMLASWVSQASFTPLGLSIAVAKDRAIEALMQVGDTFVLNILEEGKYASLMRHFLQRFAPGEDRFVGVETLQAENGSPILKDALTFLECRVASRMETPDHWLVYSAVKEGKASNPEGLIPCNTIKLAITIRSTSYVQRSFHPSRYSGSVRWGQYVNAPLTLLDPPQV
jgi:flavin reductase (DIM6/NTAB) family NADH-FMN oxidoreductase RutF